MKCEKCIHQNVCFRVHEKHAYIMSPEGDKCEDFIGTSYDVSTHIWADVRGATPIFTCGHCHEMVAFQKFDKTDMVKRCEFCGAMFNEDPFAVKEE